MDQLHLLPSYSLCYSFYLFCGYKCQSIITLGSQCSFLFRSPFLFTHTFSSPLCYFFNTVLCFHLNSFSFSLRSFFQYYSADLVAVNSVSICLKGLYHTFASEEYFLWIQNSRLAVLFIWRILFSSSFLIFCCSKGSWKTFSFLISPVSFFLYFRIFSLCSQQFGYGALLYGFFNFAQGLLSYAICRLMYSISCEKSLVIIPLHILLLLLLFLRLQL